MNLLGHRLIALGILIVGMTIIVFAIVIQQRATESADWPTAVGSVTKSTIITKTIPRRTRSTRPSTRQLAEIEYRYSVDATQLRHKQIYFVKLSVGQALKKYPLGAIVNVTYNPDDVNDSFLEPPDPESSTVVIALGSLCILTSIVMLAFLRPAPNRPTPVRLPEKGSMDRPQ